MCGVGGDVESVTSRYIISIIRYKSMFTLIHLLNSSYLSSLVFFLFFCCIDLISLSMCMCVPLLEKKEGERRKKTEMKKERKKKERKKERK